MVARWPRPFPERELANAVPPARASQFLFPEVRASRFPATDWSRSLVASWLFTISQNTRRFLIA